MIHNQRVIAQPAGLGGIVRHSYYGRFSRVFHAKDDLFNDLSIIMAAVGGRFIGTEDLGPGRRLNAWFRVLGRSRRAAIRKKRWPITQLNFLLP